MHIQIPNVKTYDRLIQGQTVGLVLVRSSLPKEGDLIDWSFLEYTGTAKIVRVIPEHSAVDFVLYVSPK